MASYIMAGRIQAAIFVVLSTIASLFISPLILISNAAIALITLRKGWQQGVIYTLLATATLVIISIAQEQQTSTNSIVSGLVNWLPIVLTASALTVTQSWSRTLKLTLILSIAGVLLFHLLHPNAEEYWKPVLEKFKPLLQQLSQLKSSQIDEIINNAATLMTGTFASALAAMTVISLIIARSWQAKLYNPDGFGKEFRQIVIGKQFAIALLVGIAIAVISKNQVIIELIMIGVTIFMFQGLSLVHALVKQRVLSPALLVGLYVLMLLLLQLMIILLATFGIIDNFVDFRRNKASTE